MPITCPHCEREIDVPEIMELDENQTLPSALTPEGHVDWVIRKAQGEMIEAGWRKVKS